MSTRMYNIVWPFKKIVLIKTAIQRFKEFVINDVKCVIDAESHQYTNTID